MIDSKILKENPNSIREMLSKRNMEFHLDDIFNLDKNRRNSIIELQNTNHKKNLIAKEIAVKRKNNMETSDQIQEMNKIGEKIKALEKENREIEEKYKKLLHNIPNFFHDSIPIGKDESANKIIKVFNKNTLSDNLDIKYGHTASSKGDSNDKANASTQIKNHIDISNELDLLDLERAGKIAGARFYFLKNDLVKLGLALTNFAIDYLIERDYEIIQPPYMIKKEAMEGAVILSDFEETIYKIENEDLYMIGTSEHPLASMHMNEILEGKRLPLRYAGISPCFRKEAGAHGKDMKGIFRVHQFDKVEQFVFSRPSESWKEHERLLETTEEFYKILDIPFRTIVLCTGDLGKVSAKTYDIEAWFPAQNSYREICSCSNCTDYQSRSLKIRFRNNPNEETTLVHTLNSTLVAIQRTMVAIIENYQTREGTIRIPLALQKYMNNKEEIKLKK
ncbi:MAG: serine--tRNA ligase [Nitrosopumilus sp.]|nr:serine--tRNA ligase [Nitrosopumilus sp.]